MQETRGRAYPDDGVIALNQYLTRCDDVADGPRYIPADALVAKQLEKVLHEVGGERMVLYQEPFTDLYNTVRH